MKRLRAYQAPRYYVTFSIGQGQTSGKYGGYTNLKQARKEARSMAKGNTAHGQSGSWRVYKIMNDLEPIAQGKV